MSLNELPDDELMDFLRRRLPIHEMITISGEASDRPLIEHLVEDYHRGRAALAPYIAKAEVPRVIGVGANEPDIIKETGLPFDIPTEDDLSIDLEDALICCRKIGADKLVSALKRAIMYEKVLVKAGILKEENGRLHLVGRKSNVRKVRKAVPIDSAEGMVGLEAFVGEILVDQSSLGQTTQNQGKTEG